MKDCKLRPSMPTINNLSRSNSATGSIFSTASNTDYE